MAIAIWVLDNKFQGLKHWTIDTVKLEGKEVNSFSNSNEKSRLHKQIDDR
jgi:hypothetical protein